jgi:hypothetical protein
MTQVLVNIPDNQVLSGSHTLAVNAVPPFKAAIVDNKKTLQRINISAVMTV